MKGVLKFLLLYVIWIIAGMSIGLILALSVSLICNFKIAEILLSVINDGHIDEVIVAVSQGISFYICSRIAEKILAYKSFKALCIAVVLQSIYGIVSGIAHNEAIITYIISIAVSIVFFSLSKDLIKNK